MGATINTYKCPACTGPLQFAAGSGKLECEYCGSSYEVAEVEAFYAKEAEAAAPKLKCPACKTELNNEAVTFELAARFYSEDPSTRTNGGQMADPNTGSSYFEIDQLKPQDYAAIRDLKEGEISDPVESLDNEGRDGNTVYKIIKVDKILPAHPATFNNDYNLLLDNARSELQVKAIEDFISSKIKSTYIVIDPMFEDCVFERDGWYEKFRKAE